MSTPGPHDKGDPTIGPVSGQRRTDPVSFPRSTRLRRQNRLIQRLPRNAGASGSRNALSIGTRLATETVDQPSPVTTRDEVVTIQKADSKVERKERPRTRRNSRTGNTPRPMRRRRNATMPRCCMRSKSASQLRSNVHDIGRLSNGAGQLNGGMNRSSRCNPPCRRCPALCSTSSPIACPKRQWPRCLASPTLAPKSRRSRCT